MSTTVDWRFQRVAGMTAILAGVAALASGGLSLAVVPASTSANYWAPVLAKGTGAATTLHFAMVLDIFGYYLLLAPLALFLQSWLGGARPGITRLYTVSGLAYMLLGALGAVIIAAVVPQLMTEYVNAPAQRREMLRIVFNAVISAVDQGIWNGLEMLPVGIWLLGIGGLLSRHRPRLGFAAMILGAAALLDVAGTMLGVPIVAQPGLGIYLAALPLWSLAVGIALVRAPVRAIGV